MMASSTTNSSGMCSGIVCLLFPYGTWLWSSTTTSLTSKTIQLSRKTTDSEDVGSKESTRSVFMFQSYRVENLALYNIALQNEAYVILFKIVIIQYTRTKKCSQNRKHAFINFGTTNKVFKFHGRFSYVFVNSVFSVNYTLKN